MSNFDVIIIGTGVAGLAASKVVAQKGLRAAKYDEKIVRVGCIEQWKKLR